MGTDSGKLSSLKCVGVRHATEPGDTYASSNQCEKKQMLGILTGHTDLATACKTEKDRLRKGLGAPGPCAS